MPATRWASAARYSSGLGTSGAKEGCRSDLRSIGRRSGALTLNLDRVLRCLPVGGKWIRTPGPARTGDDFEPDAHRIEGQHSRVFHMLAGPTSSTSYAEVGTKRISRRM